MGSPTSWTVLLMDRSHICICGQLLGKLSANESRMVSAGIACLFSRLAWAHLQGCWTEMWKASWVSGLELAQGCFCLILLAKASYKFSLDSGCGETYSISWNEEMMERAVESGFQEHGCKDGNNCCNFLCSNCTDRSIYHSNVLWAQIQGLPKLSTVQILPYLIRMRTLEVDTNIILIM